MLSLAEINKAINDKLRQAIKATEFAGVRLLAEDLAEPILRPSLKVCLEASTNGLFNSNCREKNLTYRVYFFAKDKYNYKNDNSKMQDIIENVFLTGLVINGAYVQPEITAEVTDTVLVLSFDIFLIELLEDKEVLETIETLKYKEVRND